jgi:hypothetical protein
MESVFGNRLRQAIDSKRIDSSTEDARAWLRQKAKNTRSNTINATKVLERSSQVQQQPFGIGKMFLFAYDAKHKDTLPYWDRFPLIFPFSKLDDGFLGINMHYLPPPLRAKLMDALYDTINNDKMDETTKLKISYSILNSASKFKYFAPCIKRYLNSHIDSRMVYIDPKEWDYALFIPLQRFQKAHANKVYADSRKIINKR